MASPVDQRFQNFARRASIYFGTNWAFLIALVTVVAWLASGPIFHYSETWQLVINTATTIVTFLMVFLIQATQNRESRATQLKLDELIRSSKARNVFAHLENATDAEIAALELEFAALREKVLQRAAERVAGPRAVNVAPGHKT